MDNLLTEANITKHSQIDAQKTILHKLSDKYIETKKFKKSGDQAAKSENMKKSKFVNKWQISQREGEQVIMNSTLNVSKGPIEMNQTDQSSAGFQPNQSSMSKANHNF